MVLRQVLVHKVVAKNKDFGPVLQTDLARGLVASCCRLGIPRHLQTQKTNLWYQRVIHPLSL